MEWIRGAVQLCLEQLSATRDHQLVWALWPFDGWTCSLSDCNHGSKRSLGAMEHSRCQERQLTIVPAGSLMILFTSGLLQLLQDPPFQLIRSPSSLIPRVCECHQRRMRGADERSERTAHCTGQLDAEGTQDRQNLRATAPHCGQTASMHGGILCCSFIRCCCVCCGALLRCVSIALHSLPLCCFP